jgi:hypothetical protein
MDEHIEQLLTLIKKNYGEDLAEDAFHFLYGTAGMPRSVADGNSYGIELVAAFHDALERWLLKHDPDAPSYLAKSRQRNLMG